jgi:hypothetical protein
MIGKAPGTAVELGQYQIGHGLSILHFLYTGRLIGPALRGERDPKYSGGEKGVLKELSELWFLEQLPSLYRRGERGWRR